MNEERERIRCRNCELVQWSEQPNCRRCGAALPEPIVKIVEQLVEKVVIRQDPECLAALEQAQKLIATASERLSLQASELASLAPATASFPTLAEVERAMIVAAYQRSRRKPLEAARLLGIGKTTFYRKLREAKRAA
jgi:transcriptional regulator of acetoin/glycerol metabolism